MRQLIYYVAITLDGFIAAEDGSFAGFPVDEAVIADFFESFSWFDVVLMGRKTYEVGLAEGVTSPYPMMRQYLFSRTMTASPDEAVTLVQDDAVTAVRALKEEGGRPIWLCGGAQLATTLFKAGLIDQLIVKLNPVLFGRGISLLTETIPPTQLHLQKYKVYEGGTLLLHYDLITDSHA